MKNFRHTVTIPLSQLLDKVFVVSSESQTTLLVGISILDFDLTEDARYHSVYRMRDEMGKDYSNLLELHIIELRKTLTGNSRIDDWIRLFNAKTEEDLHMIRTKNAGVQRAKYVIQEMSLTESFREAVEYYRKKKMDRKSEDAYVYDQGREAGEQIGMKRGMEQGIEVFILDKLEENIPKERIIEKLQKRFELSQTKAESYVERYMDSGSIADGHFKGQETS